MSDSFILATYLIESQLPIEQAAEMIAGEQSSETFVPVPGETAELKARARATIQKIELLESVHAPSLPGSRPAASKEYRRARVQIAFPFENMGCNLQALALDWRNPWANSKQLAWPR